MSADTSGFDTPVEALQAARDDGILAGREFLQLLIEGGETVQGALNVDAGHIFGNVVFEEFGRFVKAKNKEIGFARMSGFLGFIGELLWQQTAQQREAIQRVFEAPVPAQTLAEVIPIRVPNIKQTAEKSGGGDDE